MDIKQILCKSDSQLVVSQLKDKFVVQETLLQQYYHFVKNLLQNFSEVTIHHIRREHNTQADTLSRLTTTRKKGLYRSVIHVTLTNPSVGSEECMATEIECNWMAPIKLFLIDGTFGEHSEKTMKQQVTQFLLIDE